MQLSRSDSELALKQLPASLRFLINLERNALYQPDRFLDASLDPTFDATYLPQNSSVLLLPCYWVNRKFVRLYACHRSCADELGWPAGDGANDDVLFPIHPLSLPYYRSALTNTRAREASGLRVFAVPTSSPRTVLAWRDNMPEGAVFLKLSLLPSAIFGDRRILTSKGAACTGLTRLIEEGHPTLAHALRYMGECVSMSLRDRPDASVIIRRIPGDVKRAQNYLVPLFALIGGDPKRPLILTIAKQHGASVVEFAETVLCAQFARTWLSCTLGLGLYPEAHGQNLLLVLSPTLRQHGPMFYRDFDGLYVDWALRRARELPTPSDMPWAWQWFNSYEQPFVAAPCTVRLWWKLQTSLHAYLHFFLHELTQCLLSWKLSGLMPDAHVPSLTAVFSKYLFEGIAELLSPVPGGAYDIHEQPRKFHRHFLTFRGELMRAKMAERTPLQSASDILRPGAAQRSQETY